MLSVTKSGKTTPAKAQGGNVFVFHLPRHQSPLPCSTKITPPSAGFDLLTFSRELSWDDLEPQSESEFNTLANWEYLGAKHAL